MNGQGLQVVDILFTYLGNTLSRAVHIDDEMKTGIAKAIAAFGSLHGNVWDRSGIRTDTQCTKLWCCHPSYTLVRLGQSTSATPGI